MDEHSFCSLLWVPFQQLRCLDPNEPLGEYPEGVMKHLRHDCNQYGPLFTRCMAEYPFCSLLWAPPQQVGGLDPNAPVQDKKSCN